MKSRKENYSSEETIIKNPNDINLYGFDDITILEVKPIHDTQTKIQLVKQADNYQKAIGRVLYFLDLDVYNFTEFAEALHKHYGITAKCYDNETVEYSCEMFPATLTSNDIVRIDGIEFKLHSMSDLKKCFARKGNAYEE